MSIVEKQIIKLSPVQQDINTLAELTENTSIWIKDQLVNIHQAFWFPKNSTTEEILAVLGPKAIKLFMAANLIEQLIQLEEEGYTAPSAPRQYERHEDGTITVGPLPETATDTTPIN